MDDEMEDIELESQNKRVRFDESSIKQNAKTRTKKYGNRFARNMGKICGAQLCFSVWTVINSFLAFSAVWGFVNIQCEEPSYTCYYIYGDYPEFCMVFLPLPDRNITCSCPPNADYGSFECYIPYDEESEYCFAYACDESVNPRLHLAGPAILIGMAFGTVSISAQIATCAIFLIWLRNKDSEKNEAKT
jgi:hypothetical protein